MLQPGWQLDGTTAKSAGSSVTATLDLRNPARGLLPVSDDVRMAPLALLRVHLPGATQDEILASEELVDYYVRGSDLVMTYAETADRPYRSQMYWRLLPPTGPEACPYGVELIASVQTALLHSRPDLEIDSLFPVAQALQNKAGAFVELAAGAAPKRHHLAEGCCLIRAAEDEWSWVQMLHPESAGSTELESLSGGQLRLRHRLFSADHLEKGVILRGRVRCFLVPRGNDRTVAARVYQDFLASSPPLTV